MTTDNIAVYETRNITLAAALICHGCTVAFITMSGRGMQANFSMNGVTETMLNLFDQGRLQVDPTEFHMRVKRLTSMAKAVAKEDTNG